MTSSSEALIVVGCGIESPSADGPSGKYLAGMQHFMLSTAPDNLFIQPGMLLPVSRKASSSVKWLQFLRVSQNNALDTYLTNHKSIPQKNQPSQQELPWFVPVRVWLLPFQLVFWNNTLLPVQAPQHKRLCELSGTLPWKHLPEVGKGWAPKAYSRRWANQNDSPYLRSWHGLCEGPNLNEKLPIQANRSYCEKRNTTGYLVIQFWVHHIVNVDVQLQSTLNIHVELPRHVGFSFVHRNL